jgi:hypothetical protein
MTKYEAENIKQYTIRYWGKTRLITTKDFIANAIDSPWLYSVHWKNETWVQQAKQDCSNRIRDVTAELNNLKTAFKLLESIEPETTEDI